MNCKHEQLPSQWCKIYLTSYRFELWSCWSKSSFQPLGHCSYSKHFWPNWWEIRGEQLSVPQQKVRIFKNMLNHNALLIWSVNLNDLIGFMDFKRQKICLAFIRHIKWRIIWLFDYRQFEPYNYQIFICFFYYNSYFAVWFQLNSRFNLFVSSWIYQASSITTISYTLITLIVKITRCQYFSMAIEIIC